MTTAPQTVRPLLLTAALAWVLFGCDDPACVFSPDGCFGPGATPGALGAFATLPPEGAILRAGRPTILSVQPNGGTLANTTPLVVAFSESMAGSTLADAFSLVRTTQFGELQVPFLAQQLAVGQVWVILPQGGLAAGEPLALRYVGGTDPARDLTGESLDQVNNTTLATFNVANPAPTLPRLVATWPLDNALARPRDSQILAIFDRPMDPATFDQSSFLVQVAGADAPFPADPQPISIGSGPFQIPDNRLWSWRSLDGSGENADLGADQVVSVTLSPSGSKLADVDGGELAQSQFDFRTGFLLQPTAASLQSQPNDAIGIQNLTQGGSDELRIETLFPSAQAGDRLVVHLFGTALGTDPAFVAVRREVTVVGDAPIESQVLGLTELDLLLDSMDGMASFADGDLFFGFALLRGTEITATRLLDLDSDLDGIQTPVLDTKAPTLLSIGGVLLENLQVGQVPTFRTDLRRTALFGRADETLRALEVNSTLASTVAEAPVVDSDSQGRFLSAGLDIGRLTPAQQGTALEFRLFDRALNSSATLYTVNLRQLGGMGPEPLAPGGQPQTIDVEVFDANTLLPIPGATVISYAQAPDFSSFTELGFDTSDTDGLASVASHVSGQGGTTLTVVAPSYDLFTINDLAVATLSIPLRRSLPQLGTFGGTVSGVSAFAQLSLPLSDIAVHEARLPASARALFAAQSCSVVPNQGPVCPFGPTALESGTRPGASSLFTGEFNLPLQSFSPALFLTGFDRRIGAAALAPAGGQTVQFTIDNLLSEPGVPVEELPISAPNAGLTGLLTNGLDFNGLVDDGLIAGTPDVHLDIELAGIARPFVVGLGVAFPVSNIDWLLRGVYPGALSQTILDQGALQDALHYAIELRDSTGAVSGTRLTLAQVAVFGNQIFAANVPSALSPLDGASLPQAGFVVGCANALVDSVFALSDPNTQLGNGLYRARLVDASGRGWDLYRADLDEDLFPEVNLAAPVLPVAAGSGLATGAASLHFESSAWQAWRSDDFLWSEFEGRRQYYGRSADRSVVLQ